MKAIILIRYVLFFGILNYNNCSNSQEMKQDEYNRLRQEMVDEQLKGRGITNSKVLEVFRTIPRHQFVPDQYRSFSYTDGPLPIGFDQTISQPYIVAYMTEILEPDSTQIVLEIGTGSGYQAAILSKLYKMVYTIEIIDSLAQRSQKIFSANNYNNIQVKIGDGYKGWQEHAPFDAIIVTCAPTSIPEPLTDQLAEGGKMIIPAGESYNQVLYLITKKNGKLRVKATLPVRFVPMIKQDKGVY